MHHMSSSVGRIRRLVVVLTCALTTAALGLTSIPAHAETVAASGTFAWTTAPGILPAWDSAGISLVGVSPGSVITNKNTNTARVSLPLIAKSGTANAAAGGFRFVNTETGEQIRCSVPTVDTRARVVDCVLASGYNAALFEISSIESRNKIDSDVTKTTVFQGMELRIINREMANRLNDELNTNVFSASVVVGTGSLVVTRDR